MPKIDCLKTLMKQFPKVDRNIIEDFVTRAQEVKQGTTSVEKFLELSGKELEDFSKEQLMFRKTLIDDFMKRQNNLDILTNDKFIKDPRKGFTALHYGENFTPGSQSSISTIGETAKAKWHQMYEEEIYNKGLHNLLQSSLSEDIGGKVGLKSSALKVQARDKLSYDVRQMMVDGVIKNQPLNKSQLDLKTYQGQVTHIADTFSRIYEDMRQMQNDNGGFVAKYDGYAGKTSHNPDKLINAVETLQNKGIEVPKEILDIKDPKERNFRAWQNYYEPRLNIPETYARVGVDKESFWQNAYDDIVFNRYGKTIAEGKQEFNPDSKSGYNLVGTISRGKKFIPLDGKSTAEYQDIFGHGNVLDDLKVAMDTSSKNVGFLKTYGSQPEESFKRLLDTMKVKYQEMKFDPTTKETAEEGLKALDQGTKKIKDEFMSLNGAGGGAASDLEAKIAKGMSYAKSIQVPLKLGSSIIKHTINIPSSIGLISSATGQDIMNTSASWMNQFVKSIFLPGYIKEGTAITKVAIDHVLSERIGPYEARDLPTGILSKSIQGFFKLNGMSHFIGSAKNATGIIMSKIYAIELEKQYSDLHPNFKKTLGAYNIFEPQWKEMKAGVINHPKLGKIFSPEAMGDTPTSLLARSYTNAPIELGNVTATAKLRNRMYGLDPINTIKGQVTRAILSFTGPFYAIGENRRRIFQANQDFKSGSMGVSAYVGSLLVASAGSYYLGQKLKGEETDFKSPEALLKVITGTGLLGWQTDRLVAEFERGQKLSPGAAFNAGTSFLGPTGNDIGKALALTTGKDKVSAGQKASFIAGMIPGNNLWWSKVVFGNMLKDSIHSYYDPQWKAKAETRRIREQRKKGF